MDALAILMRLDELEARIAGDVWELRAAIRERDTWIRKLDEVRLLLIEEREAWKAEAMKRRDQVIEEEFRRNEERDTLHQRIRDLEAEVVSLRRIREMLA